MNYLSHFYFDRNSTDPVYIFGSMLPDFADQFPRTIRNKLRVAPVSARDTVCSSLMLGIERHYAIDGIFHHSDYFTYHVNFIKQLFAREGMQQMPQRRYIVAHVLYEMLLDRLLLKKHPATCLRFYTLLEQLDVEAVDNSLEHCGVEAEVRQRLFAKLPMFLSHRYLLSYHLNGRISGALQRMYNTLGLKDELLAQSRNEDNQVLERTIEAGEREVAISFGAIFQEVANRLSANSGQKR
jgi:hypothetical protein